MKLIFEEKITNKYRSIRILRYAIAAILLSFIHVVLLDLVSVGGITPDLLLILVVWITLAEGRFIGLFAGFAIGLLFDIISFDVIGLNALVKTIVAFIAGWFYREGKFEQTVGRFRFLFIIFLSSMIHNLIYFFFYIKISNISYFSLFLKYGLAISFYTTVFAILVMFYVAARKRI